MKQESMAYTQEKTFPDEAQTLDLLGKDLESAILNIFTELKEMMSKKLKESIRQYPTKQRVSIKTEIIRKAQWKFGVEKYNN